MSWARPQPLTAFAEDGPLGELKVPEGDILVHRQVLAQPGPELASRAWARLADGTPLITGAPQGKGWLVLVHTTANTTWSNLPLSGVFVDLLQRIVALAPGAGGGARGVLAPIEVLDADGHLGEPNPAAQPIAAAELATTPASPQHPPGCTARSRPRRKRRARRSIWRRRCPICRRCNRATCRRAARLHDLGGDRSDAVAAAGGAAAGAGRHADRAAAARAAVAAPRRGCRCRGARLAAAGFGPGPARRCRRRSNHRRHRGDPAGVRADRAERDRRAQPGRPGGPHPGAQPAYRRGRRRAARRQSRGRRPEPLSVALLANPERSSRFGLGRGRTARRLSAPRRHDPVRYRRCRTP